MKIRWEQAWGILIQLLEDMGIFYVTRGSKWRIDQVEVIGEQFNIIFY